MARIADHFARKCARYLRVPTVRVMLMTGKLTPEDFLEPGGSFEEAVASALEHIAHDPAFGHLVTPAVREGSADAKHFLVRLYERAAVKQLLPPIPLNVKA